MPHSYASSLVTDGAEGRISRAATMSTTGNRIAIIRNMRIGIYPLGMATI
jgi:hypothetical protein